VQMVMALMFPMFEMDIIFLSTLLLPSSKIYILLIIFLLLSMMVDSCIHD
jgi:hypothetical protein